VFIEGFSVTVANEIVDGVVVDDALSSVAARTEGEKDDDDVSSIFIMSWDDADDCINAFLFCFDFLNALNNNEVAVFIEGFCTFLICFVSSDSLVAGLN
jgi:hypothetical protein